MTSPAQQLQQEIEESGRMDSRPIEFYQELIDYGIESLEQFEDSYQGQYTNGAEFAEDFADSCGYMVDIHNKDFTTPAWITSHIDWEAVWSRELRFDFFAIKVGVQGYEFFNSNF